MQIPPFEDIRKRAMRKVMDKVYSWKQEYSEEYSRFSVEMMKVERNDFSCYERIFKMAASFVPTSVLVECQKLLSPDFADEISTDESVALTSQFVDEMMKLKGYLKFGVYTEPLERQEDTSEGENDNTEEVIISEFSLSDKDFSEEDDEHIYIPFVTAQEFWESLPSFIQMAVFTFGKGHSADELATLTKRIMLSSIHSLPDIFVNLRDQALATKGKHGRRTIQQEELSIDDILIAEDKEALKAAILTALNNMEHEYETAYIKAALIRSGHLDPNISIAAFLRAICDFAGKKYKYDSAQRVDSFIRYEKNQFKTSKSSKWQRGRRIVSYLTEKFDEISNISANSNGAT